MAIKLNWFKLTPSENEMKIWKLDTSNARINAYMLVHIMNKDRKSFTAVLQSNDYLNFARGIYFVTPYPREDEIKQKVIKLIYQEETPILDESDGAEVNDCPISSQSTDSVSFISGRILQQRMEQELSAEHKGFEFNTKIGTGNLIVVTIPIPHDVDPYIKSSDCREFFSVGKSLELLIQHDFDSNGDSRLYLVGRLHYRRNSNLELKRVIEYLTKNNIGLSELLGVLVNYRPVVGKGSLVCRIAAFKEGNVILKDSNNVESIEKEFSLIDLNQTFEKTRNFIERNLCEKFGDGEKWTRGKNKIWPIDSLENIQNAVEKEFRPIIENGMREFEVSYSIDSIPMKV